MGRPRAYARGYGHAAPYGAQGQGIAIFHGFRSLPAAIFDASSR